MARDYYWIYYLLFKQIFNKKNNIILVSLYKKIFRDLKIEMLKLINKILYWVTKIIFLNIFWRISEMTLLNDFIESRLHTFLSIMFLYKLFFKIKIKNTENWNTAMCSNDFLIVVTMWHMCVIYIITQIFT